MVSQLQGRDGGGEGAAASGAGYRGRQGVDAARIEEIKQLYGFDKPAPERFWQMVQQFARFDLGKAFLSQRCLGVDQRKVASLHQFGLVDVFLELLHLSALRCRQGGAFWLAIRYRHQFDRVGRLRDSRLCFGRGPLGSVWWAVAMVSLARFDLYQLGAIGLDGTHYRLFVAHRVARDSQCAGLFAVITMLTKNAMLEEIRKQYVLTARAKGLSSRRVLWVHVFRNALIPLVTGFPAAFVGAFLPALC